MLEFKEQQLLRLIDISKGFIDSTAQQLSYLEISNYMLELSGAKYVAFNIYNSNKKELKTIALSGDKKNIEKSGLMLGFDIIERAWDDGSTETLKDKSIIHFKTICDLAKSAISTDILKKIQTVFNTGEIIIVNIIKDDHLIGNFTLIMEEGQSFISREIVKLYASQVALLMEKNKTTQEYERSKKRFESIIEATNIGTWEWNIQTGETIFNESWAKMIGYTLEEISPTTIETWLKYLNPKDVDEYNTKIEAVFSKKESYYSMKSRVLHKNGHWISILAQGKVFSWTKDGKPLSMIGTQLDITESERLKDEYQRFFAVNLDLFCIAHMDGNLINVNDSWERLLGYDIEYLQTQNFLHFIHPEDVSKTKEAMVKLQGKEEVFGFINRYRCFDGSYRYIEWLSQPYDNLIYASGRDITDKYEKQREVEFLSFRDYLTGLYNRRYMEDAIKQLDTPRNLPFTLMVLDINGLKLTNDAFGHQMGDKLLQSVSNILKKVCRSDDIIGRVGGDEFLILLPNTNYAGAKNIKERMIKEAKKSHIDSFIISFAIGYAVKTIMSQDITQIEKAADKNMYRHKSKYGKIMRNETIETALSNVFGNDDTEQAHAERVSLYCEQIARAMGLPPRDIEDAKISGILHDIGKITIPTEISNNTGKLTKAEWEEVKRHSVSSYNILKGADKYASLAVAVLYHHERLDGKGYPEGLKGGQIPLLSRIITIADAYESMTATRLYKKTKTKQEAILELKNHSGTQFDAEIVNIFVNKVLAEYDLT